VNRLSDNGFIILLYEVPDKREICIEKLLKHNISYYYHKYVDFCSSRKEDTKKGNKLLHKHRSRLL